MKTTLTIALALLLGFTSAAWPATISAARPVQSARTIHVVSAGDTLSGIAARYGATLADLKAANNIINPNQIYEGMALLIPRTTTWSSLPAVRPAVYAMAAPAYPQAASPATTAGGCADIYVVKQGDTVSAIARRCGKSTATLLRINNLDAYGSIYVGQILALTGTTASPQPYAPIPTSGGGSAIGCSNPYTVLQGDTLSAIGLRCGVTVSSLMRWNQLFSDTIQIGQSLITRGASAAPTPTWQSRFVPVTPEPPSRWAAPAASQWAPPTPRIEATISPW